MQAIVHDSYGPLEALQLRDIAPPEPAAGEVLVRVRAAGLHVGDCFTVRGSPLVVRTETGLLRPKHGIPGYDLAGEVAAVGPAVEGISPGDQVFGTGRGTCAEYARASHQTLAPKPATLSFEAAAALPTSALAALHALRDVGGVAPGRQVLINGASGGVGTFAVQIAKSFGAEVTGVCGPGNVALVRSLGADEVIDYTREDFTRSARRYDLILDNVENRPLRDCRRVLRPGGTLILNSGTGARGLRFLLRLLAPLALSPFVPERLRRFISTPNQANLVALGKLAASGTLKPVIDRTVPLRDTAAALAHIESGHAKGKVVVTMPGARKAAA
ncbi:MAG TPA: NAD(P)-dependent alcohol dehydrogenase [Gemmatimonadales bacterium]|nr:NAD(P)-dependent alcohol dehydrogenase [Gemmatimonadales bacterium]